MDSDDDDLDFDDFNNEDEDVKLPMSANLLDAIGRDVNESKVHVGDVDEGQLTWVAPAAPGLHNSSTVTDNEHWKLLTQNQIAATEEPPETPPLFRPPMPNAAYDNAYMPAAGAPPVAPPFTGGFFGAPPMGQPAFGAQPAAQPAFSWSAFGQGDGGLPTPGSMWQ